MYACGCVYTHLCVLEQEKVSLYGFLSYSTQEKEVVI